jgi:hypothetical protein
MVECSGRWILLRTRQISCQTDRTILPWAHGAYHTTAYEVQYILLVALQSPRIARMKRTQPPKGPCAYSYDGRKYEVWGMENQ